VKLQLEELMGGVEDERRLVMLDYFTDEREWHLDQGMDALSAMGTEELLDSKAVGATLHLPGNGVELDTNVQPRGYRLLSRIPRLPDAVIERIVNRFGTLQKIMRATIDDLDDVTGVGQSRARAIKEGLSRLAETSILDRYS
jgi:diadenylate cyclase